MPGQADRACFPGLGVLEGSLASVGTLHFNHSLFGMG